MTVNTLCSEMKSSDDTSCLSGTWIGVEGSNIVNSTTNTVGKTIYVNLDRKQPDDITIANNEHLRTSWNVLGLNISLLTTLTHWQENKSEPFENLDWTILSSYSVRSSAAGWLLWINWTVNNKLLDLVNEFKFKFKCVLLRNEI